MFLLTRPKDSLAQFDERANPADKRETNINDLCGTFLDTIIFTKSQNQRM